MRLLTRGLVLNPEVLKIIQAEFREIFLDKNVLASGPVVFEFGPYGCGPLVWKDIDRQGVYEKLIWKGL